MTAAAAKNSQKKLQGFKREVWTYYRAHKRDMPWRRDMSPYAIIVSEIMLQQTQVPRVVPKFDSWMKRFPDWRTLAKTPTRNVLKEWSGLGYNRRALYLKRIAEEITDNGKRSETLPSDYQGLIQLPGIGPNTAGAILAYAFNVPHPFIETNIRSAYIHYFFTEKKGGTKIPDAMIMPLIEETLADPKIRANPREWHWALMDYGSHLKASLPNPSRRSAHHVRQKPFKGSNRELRSEILKSVLRKPARIRDIESLLKARYPSTEIRRNLIALTREGFIAKKNDIYQIA
ncbi:MAG: endonuclease [Candidatus Parcubacteria bacterium]|nr:endonuclease [Candidatus Parcubacteria bacterium]